MRVSRSSVAVVLLSGAALAGCVTGDASRARGHAIAEADITATNAMGLRLVYDEGSQRLRATLRRPLAEGESLRLAARRGRLAAEATGLAIDCAALPRAPALPRIEETPTVVYEGPEIDPSLLANVYEPEWIIGKIAAPMLDRLAREGADSIVEACIVDEATQAARSILQTSIECAWDEDDPNAVATLGTRSCAESQGQQ
jgi:hypothetical protein